MVFITVLAFIAVPVLSIDPECYMTVPEIAQHFGYPSEVHLVRTEDDYILELHRIPHGRLRNGVSKQGRPSIFLQHGIFADGFNWAPNLPNQSAAFVFADAGFDVWISNSRGTPPSQKHIGYGPDDKRFWNFTWQDMAAYDLTSSINYVLEKTDQDGLYYVGHSQGTIIMFAKLAEDQRFATKFILHRIPNSPLALPKVLQKIISYFCSLPIAQGVCALDIGIIDGRETQMNLTRVGVYLCHTPVATSVKNILHWVQIVKSRKCEKFDYGPEGNMREYGQEAPPIFDLRKITTPTYLYWSKDDILADTDDIRDTILSAMNKTIKGSYELPHYTHLDFVYGINATNDVYRPIIEKIRHDLFRRRMLTDNRA